MRAGTLALGVLLLVAGVAVFWIGYSDLQQYGGLLGEIAQNLSPEIQRIVAQDKYMAVGGGIAAIVGLALTVFGLAANRR